MHNQRLYNIDLIRFVAALAVVAFHFLFRGHAEGGYSPFPFPEVASVALYGHLGVSCFFMISGFVIAYSAEGRSLTAFVAARASRLYPAYLVCMSLTAIVAIALTNADNPLRPTLGQYLANLTMVAPVFGQSFMDGAYWSIFVEITFYGWVAIFIALGMFEKRMPELLTAWLCIAFANEAYIGSGMLKHLFATQQAGHFVAGIVLYRLMKAGWRISALNGVMLAASVMVIALGEINAISWMRQTYAVPISIAISFAVLAASAFALILAIRIRVPLLPANICMALGGISYPLYLLHQHIGYLAFQTMNGVVDRWIAVTVTTLTLIALAWVVWRFIEVPASPRLRRFLQRYGDHAYAHTLETIRKFRPVRP